MNFRAQYKKKNKRLLFYNDNIIMQFKDKDYKDYSISTCLSIGDYTIATILHIIFSR